VENAKDQTFYRQGAPNATVNMEDVLSWNDGNVRDYLMKQNLSAMIPLCDGIDGEELVNLYAMCKTSSASMYRSLKFELLHVHHRLLSISTYLHFISRMRVICSDGLPSHAHTANKANNDDFNDDE
jgi:hypothetical protein